MQQGVAEYEIEFVGMGEGGSVRECGDGSGSVYVKKRNGEGRDGKEEGAKDGE